MTLYIINPNSSGAVTQGIATAVAPLGVATRCLTLAEGPPGIETDTHVREAANNVTRCVANLPDATGVVVACFSDPGVAQLRQSTNIEVVGIREAAVRTALAKGATFGVIAIGPASVPRHLEAFENMGVSDRVAGDRPLGLSVTDLQNSDITLERMITVAKDLRDIDGAHVLILGCAGMPQYRAPIEEVVGLPVVEPCAAGVALLSERVRFAQKDGGKNAR